MTIKTPSDFFCNLYFNSAYRLAAAMVVRPFTSTQANIVMREKSRCRDLSDLVFFLPELHFLVDWDDFMAKQQPSFNLIEYRLSDSELERFEDWVTKSHPTPIIALTGLAEKDYKVSLTFVENSNAWCVTVTGKEDAKFNSKSSLTTWSEDPLEGLVMAFFKVTVIFEGGVWKTRTESRRG